MRTKAVIFDVDGTLIDTNGLHSAAWVEAFQHFGVKVDLDDVRRQMGKGGDQLMPSFLPPDLIEQKGPEIERFRVDLFKRKYLPQARAFPGVRELFERLRAEGQSAVLASSAKADELEHYKSLAGIADLIDAATSSDDVERSKPYPDIFQAALERIRPIRPEEVVVVGDSPFDAEAARGARRRMVGLLCGGFAADTLCAAGCIAMYRDARDLLDHYEASPLAGKAAQTSN
jgi:HAD superfamily hydrolase (TIGR01509 family)